MRGLTLHYFPLYNKFYSIIWLKSCKSIACFKTLSSFVQSNLANNNFAWCENFQSTKLSCWGFRQKQTTRRKHWNEQTELFSCGEEKTRLSCRRSAPPRIPGASTSCSTAPDINRSCFVHPRRKKRSFLYLKTLKVMLEIHWHLWLEPQWQCYVIWKHEIWCHLHDTSFLVELIINP